MKNGWHKVYNCEVYVENGKVRYGVCYYGHEESTVYPYELSRYGGWDNCTGYYSIEQFRRLYKAGKISFH